jgi:DNA mismatch repair protein MutS2
LRQINRDKRYWETKRNKIRQVEKILDEMAATYETELKETKRLRKEVLAKAKEEADILLSGVNKKIENTIQEIRNSQAEKESTKHAREELGLLKKQVKQKSDSDDNFIQSKIEKLKQQEEKRNKRRHEDVKKQLPKEVLEERMELKPGDKVKIIGQNTIGDLIELNEKNAVVAFGQLITTRPRKQVERLSNNEAKKLEKGKNRIGSGSASNFSERRLTFKSEIDIRGKRVEEAISKIQEFIDEAIMFEVGQLRILHGKGNGILKETIRNYLRTEPMVRNYKDEHVDFGGAGITVVNLAL